MKKHSFYDAMNQRYAAPAWALFYEVGDGTGMKKNRSADAIAMSLYPSRGLELYGHEFKANRGDWLNELKNPDKAESIARFCDYWYAVDTSGGEAIKEEEVPSNWGLLIWNGKTLRMRKQAQKLKAVPMDRIFLAGLLRAANKEVEATHRKYKDEDWLTHLDQKSYERGCKTTEEVFERKYQGIQRENESLKATIKGFEEKSGIALNSWNWANMAEAVHMIQRLSGQNPLASSMEGAAVELADHAKKLMALAGAVKNIGVQLKSEGQPVG